MNVPLAGTSIALGAGSVGAAGAGVTGLVFMLPEAATSYGQQLSSGLVMGVPPRSYIIASIILGSLSVILAAVNLVRGIQMRERLIPLSKQIFRVPEVKALVDTHVKAKAAGGSVAGVTT